MTDHLTENARLRAALRTCVNLLDDLVAESGRGIEYGEEDAFRMGEWFDDHDLGQIDTARAALATPAPDAVQEAAMVLLRELGEYDRDRSHHAFKAASDGYSNSSKPAPFNQIGDAVIAALRAIAGDRT